MIFEFLILDHQGPRKVQKTDFDLVGSKKNFIARQKIFFFRFTFWRWLSWWGPFCSIPIFEKNFFFLEKICQKKTFYCGCEFAWAWAYFVQNFFLIILGAPTQKSTYAPTQKWPKTEKNQNFDFDSGYLRGRYIFFEIT